MRTMKSIFYLMALTSLLAWGCEKKGNQEGTDTTKKDSTQEVKKGPTGTFMIDTANSVVKWKGKKVGGAHNGSIKIKSGELKTVDGRITGGTIVIDMTTISNEDLSDKKANAKLIGHLKGTDFFDTEKNPTATFEITDVQTGSDTKDIINGNLAIKGKTDKVSLLSENKIDDNKIKSKGTTILDRTKWDIKFGSKKFGGMPGMADAFIYDEIDLEFEVVATK